ncbi:hypothetical protein PssB301D_02665 [Pseudomonas syringae pv. syringae str. B301D-R]|nr:hypothetical protein PssB301D_02665 [Pseudomonas syringae pv. syringae str. B301D-R]
MRDLVGTRVEFAVAQGLLFEHQRYGVGPCCGTGFELLVDGYAIRVVLARLVPLFEQLLTLVERQYRNGVQRSLRRLFQRIDQPFCCQLQIVAKTLRAYARRHQRSEQEAFAHIVDIDGQWVVGALFVVQRQRLHAIPGGKRFIGHGNTAVTIVEQGAEQRRRCNYAAATLGQRQ